MAQDKPKYRLSSLFSLSSTSSQESRADEESLRISERVGSSAADRSPAPGKLTKTGLDRIPSGHLMPPPAYPLPPPLQTAYEFLPPAPPFERERSDSRLSSPSHSRPASRASSRPATPVLDIPIDGQLRPLTPNTPTTAQRSKRRSWIPGSSRSRSKSREPQGPLAWVVGHQGRLPYNLSYLTGAQKVREYLYLRDTAVPELWDENGDTFVYLFPRTSGKGPSFRVDSNIYSASSTLTRLAYGGIYSSPTIDRRHHGFETATQTLQNLSLGAPSTPPMTPDQSVVDTESSGDSRDTRNLSDSVELAPRETHLYLPLTLSTDGAAPSSLGGEARASAEDVEILVAVRNLFAFLVGQSLVATEQRSSIFSIFLKISDLLRIYEFSNLDGSTFGEVADASFDNYVDELHLADVRASREKTIEGIVLGERMRSVMLYNEAFVHGVGKYEDIIELRSPKFQLISPITRNRMERASMDLYLRIKTLNTKLEDFDFPAIFSGIMNSKTADERKIVRFDAWKAAFMSIRKYILSYYKAKYGSWPPKASSKKNDLVTSGLNRLVLRDLYHDLSSLYDLIVDRSSLTTRTVDALSNDDDPDDADDPTPRALRRVLSEYDRSSPPVLPPVPFDIPLLPMLASTRKDYGRSDTRRDEKARSKKLKDEEVVSMLRASYNPDAVISTPFLDAFRDLERKAAHGSNIDEIRDLRIGQWIFMYAVLQSLPMLVIDAPAVKWTRGVEYFLCEPPRSGVPWAREVTTAQRSWYGVAGSSGVVSLPSDVVEHGVEGIYRRSHCWEAAEKWSGHSQMLGAATAEALEQPLPPPPGLSQTASGRSSPRSNRDSVMMLGLEALPLPAGVAPVIPNLRPSNSNDVTRALDPTKTFDAIIGTQPQQGKGKKKK